MPYLALGCLPCVLGWHWRYYSRISSLDGRNPAAVNLYEALAKMEVFEDSPRQLMKNLINRSLTSIDPRHFLCPQRTENSTLCLGERNYMNYIQNHQVRIDVWIFFGVTDSFSETCVFGCCTKCWGRAPLLLHPFLWYCSWLLSFCSKKSAPVWMSTSPVEELPPAAAMARYGMKFQTFQEEMWWKGSLIGAGKKNAWFVTVFRWFGVVCFSGIHTMLLLIDNAGTVCEYIQV